LQKTKPITTTIRQKVLIPEATPDDVFRAYLSSKEHTAITGSKATISSRKGAKFIAWDGYISGKNVELIRGKKIVQEWLTTEWPENYAPSTLDMTLVEKGDGTELIFVQTDVPKSQAASYRKGWWDSYWNPMKEYFAKGEGKKRKK
jgi:activator of HSP90 ATPase